jgi:hypothetical protein
MLELSEKGKLHDRQCKTYNQQAADFVFRANNSRSAADEIDLHGLYAFLSLWLIVGTSRRRLKYLRSESKLANNAMKIISMCKAPVSNF